MIIHSKADGGGADPPTPIVYVADVPTLYTYKLLLL